MEDPWQHEYRAVKVAPMTTGSETQYQLLC